jgi:uncharacterized protein
VIIEIADGLSRVKHRPLAIQLIDSIYTSDRMQIVQTDAGLERRAWTLFKSRRDKVWGMTDCVSMVLMQDMGIADVFSVDSDFSQAGFNLLIR